MARKSIKGYAEKNYYDNTRFNGGIVATHDTLNEGSFRGLVNFDISDTGQSLTPRKGFLTTTLKYDGDIITLSNSTIYFFDASIGKYIFIDFKKGSCGQTMQYIPCIYKATLDLNNMYITNVEKIDNLNLDSELLTYLRSKDIYSGIPEYNYMIELVPIDSNIAQSVIDEYGITKYIIKVTTRNIQFWMSIVYREKETKYENITYPEDTVVLSYLNFDNTVNINTADRNIASGENIIPNPIQVFHNEADEPPGFVETFPLIYVKQNDDYLLQTTQKLDDIEFIPHFALKEITDENYTWAYTYDIISTSLDSQYFNEDVIHRATLYDLKTNEILVDAPMSHSFASEYTDALDIIYENYDIPVELFDISNNDFYYNWDSSEYVSYVSDLNITTNKFFKDIAEDVLIIYACPKTFDQVDPILFDEYYNVNDISMWHLIPVLSNIYISGEDITTSAREYNDLVTQNSIFNSNHGCIKTVDKFRYISGLPNSIENVIKFLSSLNNVNNYQFYTKCYAELSDYFDEGFKGYSNYIQTALQSRIIAFKEEGMSFDELVKILRSREYTHIILKPFTTVSIFDFRTTMVTGNKFPNNTALCKLFYGLNTSVSKYYVYTDLDEDVDNFYNVEYSTIINDYNQNLPFENAFNTMFKHIHSGGDTTLLMPMIARAYPYISNYNPCTFINVLSAIEYYGESIFRYTDKTLSFTYDNTLSIIQSLHDYFTQGISINFYITKIPKKEYVDSTPNLKEIITYTREYFIATTPYVQSRQIILSSVKPTTIIQQLETEPADIAAATESLIFRSSLGDCLVLYTGNKVYMSEPSYQYYFKYTGIYEYPEPIIKVIQYKDTLLVFTTQNLYAIYPTEITNSVENGTDEEGNAKYIQVTTTVYATLPVLYNLMVDSRYKDAIQVYNQMVLFYSADGQMFMIKPSATIDSDTRFSIQYFNKSVNDILLNYIDYMQDRLNSYGIEEIIEDVNIKVSVSINYIKIFYNAPNIMTYILIYDILNNRYYVYDTLDFHNVKDIWYNDGFEVFITEHDNFMYFTYNRNTTDFVDCNSDCSQYFNFDKHEINSEIDSGVLNLNNHIKKRFKTFHTIYKNISADTILFSINTFIDSVPVYMDIQSSIEIKNVASSDTYNIIDTTNKVNLLKDNTALFNFSDYTSNKVLIHRSNIISKGKTFRTKLNFNSKGIYKILGFGIIYKEHTL